MFIDEVNAAYNAAVDTFGLAWKKDAACRTNIDGAFSTGHAARVFVRNFCVACPVRQTCLEFAVMAGEEHGIWGGIGTPSARRAAVSRDDR